MKAQLAAFIARPEVRGVTVDVGAAAKVALANALGDQYVQCPYAKNLVAGAIKEIADATRAANPGLRYVVLIGGDNVIPFFRSPDTAPLGSESDFFPPVDDDTASQASLRAVSAATAGPSSSTLPRPSSAASASPSTCTTTW